MNRIGEVWPQIRAGWNYSATLRMAINRIIPLKLLYTDPMEDLLIWDLEVVRWFIWPGQVSGTWG